MRIVVALGGNALLEPGESLTEANQRRHVAVAAESIAALAADHEVVVTHGNGPQVGLLALESEAYRELPPYGFDVLGAESQGMIGFLLEQALRNALPSRSIATILTSVEVDASDPALKAPSKPVGPLYEAADADRLTADRGWTMAKYDGGLRRVVPSPHPIRILELDAIRTLVNSQILVICAGGGGVPMYRAPDGQFVGIEGVVDKDRTSALLAEALEADALLLLTDVDAVYIGWRTPTARPLRTETVAQLRVLTWEAGSMGPKVEAACRFVESTGRLAAIGKLADATSLLEGTRGTRILP